MIRYKILVFILVMIGVFFILDRMIGNKLDSHIKIKFFTYASIVSLAGFVLGFVLFYLLS
jgi:hypothetical protein